MNKKLVKVIPASAALCLLATLLANSSFAQSQYFEALANGGTDSWDGNTWSAANSGANGGPYTSPWTPGQFARFYNEAGANVTVTVNATESMSGLYLNSGASSTLNINDAGNNTGFLSIVPGALTDGMPVQGFLTGGGNVIINAPITGSGAIEEESGGGNLELLGQNTYSGGTLFSSSSTFVDYNNNSSFGTGPIGYANTTFSIMNNIGPSSVNLINPVGIFVGTTGVNFIGNSMTQSGAWTMGTFNVNLRNNGVGTTVSLSGVLTGSGAVNISGANGGIIKMSGANQMTGALSIGSAGDTAVTLQLGANNTIANNSSVVLSGGTLNLGGFSHAMTGTLGLTANSILLFSGGSASFANSSGLTWAGILNLNDWVNGTSSLQFGTSSSGLTAAELNDIEFDNNPATEGYASLNSSGFLVEAVPEPSSLALGILGGFGSLGLIWRSRSRKA